MYCLWRETRDSDSIFCAYLMRIFIRRLAIVFLGVVTMFAVNDLIA